MPNSVATVPLSQTATQQIEQFLAEVAVFDDFGTPTRQFAKEIDGATVPFFVNEFWTSKQRAAHSLHEVSYRACFKPQLPRFFIERLTQKGDTVYDPFMGRGTTVLESAMLGRNTVGNDINPLSKILCQPRLSPPTLAEIETRLGDIPLDRPLKLSKQELGDLSEFYHPTTLTQVFSLRHYLLERQNNGMLDSVDQWIQMVATNRLTGHSSGFFSVYTLPPNQAVTADRQRRINEMRNQTPPERDIAKIILKKSKSLLSKLTENEKAALATVTHNLGTAPAEATGYIANSSINLVVTSPPFLDVVDYKSDNWLRCWFNGIDASELSISQLKKQEAWVDKMTSVFKELSRILTPEGLIAFEVGEVKGGKLLLEELVIKAAHQANLTAHAVLINDQQFTKTANCWGVDNQSKGTNTNRIVILSRLQ